jgi:uncharacterized protein YbcI
MAETDDINPPLSGTSRLTGAQLASLSNAIVGLHRRFYGRGATKARTYQVHDNLVAIEMRDAYLTVEHTLLARGQEDTVRNTRLTFQQAMSHEFIEAAERITGRRVQAYVSQAFVSPEAILEIFYLEPPEAVADRQEREAAEDAGTAARPRAGLADQDL